MNENHFIILALLKQHMDERPDLRFCQILFNLGINEFANKEEPETCDWNFRDNYNDSDTEIIDKLRNYNII